MIDDATRQKIHPYFFPTSCPVPRVLYCFTCVCSLNINQVEAGRQRTQVADDTLTFQCCANAVITLILDFDGVVWRFSAVLCGSRKNMIREIKGALEFRLLLHKSKFNVITKTLHEKPNHIFIKTFFFSKIFISLLLSFSIYNPKSIWNLCKQKPTILDDQIYIQ